MEQGNKVRICVCFTSLQDFVCSLMMFCDFTFLSFCSSSLDFSLLYLCLNKPPFLFLFFLQCRHTPNSCQAQVLQLPAALVFWSWSLMDSPETFTRHQTKKTLMWFKPIGFEKIIISSDSQDLFYSCNLFRTFTKLFKLALNKEQMSWLQIRNGTNPIQYQIWVQIRL